jgi:hypothetical protein
VIVRCHLQPKLGAKSVSSITALDLDSLYAALARQRASATVVKVHGVARGALAQAVRGLTWDALQLPPVGTGSASVHQVVLHGADDQPIVRASTKTGRSRRITLDPGTVAALRVHRERATEAAQACGAPDFGPFVFSPAPDGSEPYHPHSVTRRFTRLCSRSGSMT